MRLTQRWIQRRSRLDFMDGLRYTTSIGQRSHLLVGAAQLLVVRSHIARHANSRLPIYDATFAPLRE